MIKLLFKLAIVRNLRALALLMSLMQKSMQQDDEDPITLISAEWLQSVAAKADAEEAQKKGSLE